MLAAIDEELSFSDTTGFMTCPAGRFQSRIARQLRVPLNNRLRRAIHDRLNELGIVRCRCGLGTYYRRAG